MNKKVNFSITNKTSPDFQGQHNVKNQLDSLGKLVNSYLESNSSKENVPVMEHKTYHNGNKAFETYIRTHKLANNVIVTVSRDYHYTWTSDESGPFNRFDKGGLYAKIESRSEKALSRVQTDIENIVNIR